MSSKKEDHAALKDMSKPTRPPFSQPSPLSSASPHRILPLSAEAISQIHSSKHITSLQAVVLALLENSLDARSSEVDISVDWRRGGCSINDDGVGIPRAEFAEIGGLGRMYCTSKRAPVGTLSTSPTTTFHGSNGTFLAELAAMSLLSITSMQTGDHDSSTLALHQGKTITRYMAPLNNVNLPSTCRLHGTNISVRDLFGNMPVRVKQRALVAEGSHDKDRHELKRGIVALLLAWPLPCAVKLRDSSGQHNAMNIVGHHPRVASALTEKSLNQLSGKKTEFDLRDNMPMLFHAGLAPPESASRWVPLSASTPTIALKGMICLDPAPTKQCQFLALGISPCGSGSGNNELPDAVNKVFANSSFGVVEERPESAGNGQDQETNSGYTEKQLQAQKGVDRFPMYCIQLAFRMPGQRAGSAAENLNDATLKSLVDILEASVTAWLDSHGFRPRKRRRRRNELQQRPAVASNSTLRQSAGSTSRTLSCRRPVSQSSSVPEQSFINQDRDALRPTSKRRKIVDLSTGDASAASRPRALQDHEADVMLQSHIRAGRLEGKPHGIHRPTFSVTKRAPEVTDERSQPHHTVDRSSPVRSQATIDDPGSKPLRANSLENADQQAHSVRIPTSGTMLRPSSTDQNNVVAATGHSPNDKPAPTSDDFSGLDDADILQAEEDSGLGPAPAATLLDTEEMGGEDIVSWRDPVSKQPYRVNSRTGVVLPATSAPEQPSLGADTDSAKRQSAGINTALSSTGKPLSLSKRAALAAKDGTKEDLATKAKWLPGFLKEWNNPVFVSRQEEQISVASIDGPGLLEHEDQANCCARGAAGLHTSVQASVHAAGTKLSKVALKHAQVIAQVDRKFILCKMPASATIPHVTSAPSTLLVLIDQHAASERVILESLLSSLFTKDGVVATTNIALETTKAQTLRYIISAQEHSLFQKYQAHFNLFGIHYNSQPTQPLATNAAKQQYRLVVTDLPTVIAERCSRLPTICIDLLRSEIWSLHDGTRNAVSTLSASREHELARNEPYWIKILPLLPPRLLALLQSRSCRSAVMFNDFLSFSQCEALVTDLGGRVFPFGCAHGRVSMVPLVDMGKDGEGIGTGIGDIEKDTRWTRRSKDESEEYEIKWSSREGGVDVGALGAWMKGKKPGAKHDVDESAIA
ncbi:DNA mismatch repair protein MLH3 [Fulvia fulva]|uniref:DNA mismatch repair protein MLH3 n=1 Tax=Passalora fulva TaxID=5499 RepID=A0A9Q8PL65_PASFU|nr:DNA mismatch repair protein MLH3 [Fulvia fulva]UJO24508.1 DNA mismatch repair protein MLH3 [Fulvia fulva]WPV22370.1 DNA mismatch repair protein MLH3 [Fulvia fulva]WPV36879.1 DNA mismatch repair protein MLH3 [Fulvia fulva]